MTDTDNGLNGAQHTDRVPGDPGHAGPVDTNGASAPHGGFASSIGTSRLVHGAYERALIGYLKDLIRDSGPTLEIDAATGILTGQLWRSGVQMVALERTAGPLVQLRRSLPAVPAVRGVPMALPFGPSSFGSVVYVDRSAANPSPDLEHGHQAAPRQGAQPWSGTAHDSIWFSVLETELPRVLRPGGLVICVTHSERSDGSDGPDPVRLPSFDSIEERRFGDRRVIVYR